MKIIKILLLILILFLGSGCPIIIPMFSEDSPSMGVFERQLKQLTMGSTTREEVISIIGEPDVKQKRSIIYYRRVQSGTARIILGFFLPLGKACCGDAMVHRTPGKWMDVSFEFDEHDILTKYHFIEIGHPDIEIGRHDDDAAKCISSCNSNYYDCLISTEKNNRPSKCEEPLLTCFEQCN